MRFTIRDLFLVTVIVAVCLAWWLDHRRRGRESEGLKDQQEQQLKKALDRARFR
jgi:cytochrome c-type biogenesis protein CcmH/NrfF